MMTGKEAMEHIAKTYNYDSLKQLAEGLSDETLTVQPIQISNYLKGQNVGQKVAERVYKLYNIEITNVYVKGVFAKQRRKKNERKNTLGSKTTPDQNSE